MTIKEVNTIIHKTREVECGIRSIMQSEIELDYNVFETLQDTEETLSEIRNVAMYLLERVSI